MSHQNGPHNDDVYSLYKGNQEHKSIVCKDEKESTPSKCADCDKLMGRYSGDHSKFSFITLLKLAEHITA